MQRTWEDAVKRMEREAIEELLHYHELSAGDKVKRLIKKALGRYVAPDDLIFWPTGMLANTLAEHLGEWEDKETVKAALCTYFDRWIEKGMPIYCIDDVLCGEALLILYDETGAEKYKLALDKMAKYLFVLAEEEADEAGSIPYRPAQKNGYIFVDSIGMMCPFLYRYGIRFNNAEAVEIALTQIENMIVYGMDGRTGLPYHGFRYENRVKYGIIGWGRAVGWLLMGMAGIIGNGQDCLGLDSSGEEEQEKEQRGAKAAKNFAVRLQKIKEQMAGIVSLLAGYQKEDGSFAWQLQAAEGPSDSSATAMIAGALLRGSSMLKTLRPCPKDFKSEETAFESEDIYREIEKIIERAADYLAACEKHGKIYHSSGECMGFSQYPQVYGAYPWALGPALFLLCHIKERESDSGKWYGR